MGAVATLIRLEEKLNRSGPYGRLLLGITLCITPMLFILFIGVIVDFPSAWFMRSEEVIPAYSDGESYISSDMIASQIAELFVSCIIIAIGFGILVKGVQLVKSAYEDIYRNLFYHSIWDGQPERWEKARLEFMEYLAEHHPEQLNRQELEAVCCGLVRCIDTPTLLDSSLPVLYEDAFGQPIEEQPELRRVQFRLHRYGKESQQRRPETAPQDQSPPQSA